MKILYIFIIAFSVEVKIASSLNTFVNTSSGPIQGTLKYLQGAPVLEFLSIPYAEPPLGNLRFLKPNPVNPWNEILDATKLPPACIQHTIYPFPGYDELLDQSEDCLYLNIYSPIYARNLPVIFWIHGGKWLFGSSRMDVYNATAMALLGNVIVVTINYRLTVLGFLTSNTTDAPGNMGMWDVLTALQWVNQNIESFGGDKQRITLAGESSGAMSNSLFCVSPLTKGLFSKVIMESGSAAIIPTNQLHRNMDISQQVAKFVGCATDNKTIQSDPEFVVGCLRTKNASFLAYGLWYLNSFSTTYQPQFGDDLFPSNTMDVIHNGNFHNVSLLIGNNRDEGSMAMTISYPETFGYFGQKDTFINKTYAAQIIRSAYVGFQNVEKYVRYYLDQVSDNDYYGIRRQTYTAVGDSDLLCPTVYFAERFAETYNDCYFYFFLHRPSNNVWAPWMGATHVAEVPFVIGKPIREPELYGPDEIELSKRMINIWTNFAKYGVPNAFWPKYSKERHEMVYLATAFDPAYNGNIYGTGPHLENCNLLRNHYGFQYFNV